MSIVLCESGLEWLISKRQRLRESLLNHGIDAAPAIVTELTRTEDAIINLKIYMANRLSGKIVEPVEDDLDDSDSDDSIQEKLVSNLASVQAPVSNIISELNLNEIC